MSNSPIEPAKPCVGREAIRQGIHHNAVFDRAFLTMNVLSAVVACYGLLEDSSAVVIGAMVIATLLGPIIGIALALVDGDNGLLRKALLAEATGAFAVLLIAILIGAIQHDAPLTNEILSRTKPRLFDLIIALAGGAAGAYATASPRLSAGLVGVAIATALVPPLSACGICLGRGEAGLGFGAFLLFATNLVAIQFASSIVLWILGYNKFIERSQSGQGVILRNASSFGLLFLLGTALSLHAVRTLSNDLHETKLRTGLIQALQAYPGTELTNLGFRRAADKEVVTAEVRARQPFDSDKVAALENELSKPVGVPLELVVHTVLVRKATRNGYLDEPDQSHVRLTPPSAP